MVHNVNKKLSCAPSIQRHIILVVHNIALYQVDGAQEKGLRLLSAGGYQIEISRNSKNVRRPPPQVKIFHRKFHRNFTKLKKMFIDPPPQVKNFHILKSTCYHISGIVRVRLVLLIHSPRVDPPLKLPKVFPGFPDNNSQVPTHSENTITVS